MTEYVRAWQCIGCGKVEAPQTCIGVCQDRKVEFVHAFEHDALVEQLEATRRRVAALEAVVRRLAFTAPRAGEWESSWRALQSQARRALTS